ncbi:hypothetical protein SNOG_10510 [Parastagonospora nodorum SN15]|uniref:Uncharacterized protein n=1 Tax=Phaeosphaeria nodorum (strain SN15 / ATCC MYA-4574 / FGSC 10173) TaxID=321614 RepID=Q0UCK4_PHANO|nr:hypothetical protein SNOG_10510 [Parastagonospora nodorum SN15]EAT81904.1 hypothetical protein SNOG_10510 [Parastagonospora nodorum SN15]
MPSPTFSPHKSKALAMHSAPDHDHGSTSRRSPPGPLRARTWSRLISSWLRVTKVSSKPQIAGLAWHLAQRGARAAMLCLRALGMASQKFQLHSKQWATLGCSRYSACNIKALIFVYPPTTIKMLPQSVLLALVATVAAVPLNINLGAYSPALVVGDGEIAIGEAKSASELMATLASGSNEAAAGAAAGRGWRGHDKVQQEQGQPGPKPLPNKLKNNPLEAEAAKRAPNLLRRAISDFISKRAPAPVQDDKIAAIEAATAWIKRDLQGFQASLAYAREAMKDSPKVELGSPNAGIGIVVNPGVNVPAGSAAAGTPSAEHKVKRDEVSDEVSDEAETPKMTLVAITEV